MISVSLSLLGQVAKTAAFGAIAGKVIDTLVLSKMNHKMDQKKWIRQAKLEAFTKLSQEILSIDETNFAIEEQRKMKEYATKAILLLDDKRLINKIDDYIYTINRFPKNCEDSSKDLNASLRSKGLDLVMLLKKNLNKV